MTEMDSLNASLEFWDIAAYFTLGAVLIGVLGESVVQFTSWISEPRAHTVGKASALILIAGLAGEMVTHAKNSELTGKITATLNLQAGQAHARASQADERSKILERDVKRLEAANLAQAEKIIDLETRLGIRFVKVETEVKRIDMILKPREVDEVRLARALHGTKIAQRNAVFIFPHVPEAQAYAEKLATTMRKQKFATSTEDLGGTSRHSGVIVCSKDSSDVKVYRALKRAGIAAKSVSLKDKAWSELCEPRNAGLRTAEAGPLDFLVTGSVVRPRPGTRVFVGQRPEN
ncbi:MAG TPA: hypothetical protein VJL90_10600 [Pseudorhodoplanes sp.]|nr:hypothetical protein [Pseudorhodoplanes sp.]